MFRLRKQKEIGWDVVVEKLSQLEPKRMERLVDIAKENRAWKYSLEVFINGRPDDLDRIEKTMKEEK